MYVCAFVALCLRDCCCLTPSFPPAALTRSVRLPLPCHLQPFRGGPFRYADSVGAQKMADTMARYADKHGERFAPPQILKDKAKAGATFHKA